MDAAALETMDMARADRDIPAARELAKAYVAAHRARMEPAYTRYTKEELVGMVSMLRQKGDRLSQLDIEAWLLSEYEPQHITGRVRPGGA